MSDSNQFRSPAVKKKTGRWWKWPLVIILIIVAAIFGLDEYKMYRRGQEVDLKTKELTAQAAANAPAKADSDLPKGEPKPTPADNNVNVPPAPIAVPPAPNVNTPVVAPPAPATDPAIAKQLAEMQKQIDDAKAAADNRDKAWKDAQAESTRQLAEATRLRGELEKAAAEKATADKARQDAENALKTANEQPKRTARETASQDVERDNDAGREEFDPTIPVDVPEVVKIDKRTSAAGTIYFLIGPNNKLVTVDAEYKGSLQHVDFAKGLNRPAGRIMSLSKIPDGLNVRPGRKPVVIVPGDDRG